MPFILCSQVLQMSIVQCYSRPCNSWWYSVPLSSTSSSHKKTRGTPPRYVALCRKLKLTLKVSVQFVRQVFLQYCGSLSHFQVIDVYVCLYWGVRSSMYCPSAGTSGFKLHLPSEHWSALCQGTFWLNHPVAMTTVHIHLLLPSCTTASLPSPIPPLLEGHAPPQWPLPQLPLQKWMGGKCVCTININYKCLT